MPPRVGTLRAAVVARHIISPGDVPLPRAEFACEPKVHGANGRERGVSAALLVSPVVAMVALVATRSRRSGVGGPNARRGLTVVAAASNAEDTTSRVAVDGDAVRVHYKGMFEDGTQFDSSEGRDPLIFTLGQKQVVPGFEAAVRGLRRGQRVSVKLPPKEAYGERREQLVFTIPSNEAPSHMKVGLQVRMQTSSGQTVPATVINVAEDGAVTVDANPRLAGRTLHFDIELVGFKEFLAPAVAPKGLEFATFAAGCFWGVELAFQRVPGVVATSVGYTQGQTERPTYEEVCSARTGHTEAVHVTFDPQKVTFDELLHIFWERVGANATTPNRAGNDEGPQYRSGIYFHGEEQRLSADASVKALQQKLGRTVVTEVEAAGPFWFAEDEHQQYLEKGGRSGNGQSAAKGCTDKIRCYG
eukprot:TRINITY_DN73667_c0_g1_i1.p1 TRINITY_DN73667_c0_g1~~TRINITY_DN73667_c0_g1_i1.p1  ORF type:complete len:466 (+),score=77.56 TRINITY_DN73667_c0_g1_i1:152-1399(+)